MNLTRVRPRKAALMAAIIMSLIVMSTSYANYSCTVSYYNLTAASTSTKTGRSTTNCDPRCAPDPNYSGFYCCLSISQVSNYDCNYGCNSGVLNNYQWPELIQPTRCDSYCPPHYYVLPADPSGTICKICHEWCGNCVNYGEIYCTSCDPAAYRLNSSACYNYLTQSYGSYNPCLRGYYGLQIQMICVACPTGCATCSIFLTWEMPGANFTANYNQGNINCTGDPLCLYTTRCFSCSSGFTLLNGLCYSNSRCLTYSYYTSVGATFNPASCNCFANYFSLGLSICAKCHISCLTCTGITQATCLTCPLGSANTSATLPTQCRYNATYSDVVDWTVGGTPAVPFTIPASAGFYKEGDANLTNVRQGSCTSGQYVFGYYGYNNNGTPYYKSNLDPGINLFPQGAKLVYNNATLPAHYGIHIRATLLFIDQWTNGLSILVQENGANAFSFVYQMEGVAGEYLCGLNYDDHLDVMDNWFRHTRSSLTNLTITASNNRFAWGIKQLIIHALVCHSSCTTCSGPTSSDCTACPANQRVVDGVCVCNSATGFYNLSGVCTTNCTTLFKDPFTYTCVPTCFWPYGFGYNNSGSLQCRTSCPPNFYQNYSNSLCVSSCYQSSITDPASNFYMFNGSNRICNNTCPSGTFGDPQSGSCVRICPTYNASTNDGYFSSGSFCYEVCPNSLFAFVPQRSCLASCPLGYFKNYKMKNGVNASICEQQCSVTLGGQYKYGDNVTGFCTDFCSTGTYGDIDTNLCLKVCNSSAFGQALLNSTWNITQRLCVINCSVADNFYGNPLTGFCVNPQNCPTNYYADPLTSLCTRNCTGIDYFGENSTRKCINTRCPNNTFADNDTKICVKTCIHNGSQIMEYGDPLTGFCVPACYGAYYADDQNNMECVLICRASPAATFGQNNKCVRNCSATTWADVYNPNRTCTTSCLINSTLRSYGLNTTRMCVLVCPDGQFADVSTGIGICTYGCPVNPNASQTGLFGNIVNNICEQVCPPPFYGDQTGNRTCVKMCPWPYFGRDCIQTGATLGTYTFTYDTHRECHLTCACGWADNVTQLCVWNSTGCAPFTFAHQTNHKCVRSMECTGFADPISRYCINPCFKNDTFIYFADNSTRMCVLVCPDFPDFYGDNATQSCVYNCPNITVRDPQGNRRCVNITTCSVSPLFLYGDAVKNLCVTALNCSDGYYADNITHQCIDVCPGPILFYADNVTKQCVSLCQLGWYALNVTAGKGICSLNCPQNLWADNKTVTCTPRCSNNTYGVNYTGNWNSFNNSFSYYGICQNECPAGQFARDFDNVCVFDCGPNLWGDTLSKTCKISPFDCPQGYYADNTSHLCVVPLNCSKVSNNQYVADNLTKTCVQKCPGTVHNFADMMKFLCVARCPSGYYGHNTTLVCQTNCTYPTISTYDGSFADPQLNICVQNCSATPQSTFGENITYTCVEAINCPTDTWADATVYKRMCWHPCPPANFFNGNPQLYGDNITRTCVTRCPTYTFSDLSEGYGICVNVCPSLTNGTKQYADRLTQSCVTVCPVSNSTFGDNITLSCVYNCPPGSFAQRLPFRYCVAVCSLGTWGETIKNTCVQSALLCPIVNGTLYYGDNLTTMCVKTCPAAMNATNVTASSPDYWGENTTRLCLPSCLLPNGTQSGFKWNQTRVCIKMCPAEIGQDGSYSDQGMCYGVCMTPNYFRDPQNKRSCQPTCSFSPNKQYADNTTMRCVPKCPTYPQQLYAYDPTKTCESTCPNSYRKYEALKTCVSVCPNDTFFNPDTYQCLSQCPLTTSTNQTLYGDPSLSEPKCVTNSSCSAGYYADSIVGLCVQVCTEGQWIFDKNCVQICPLGYYGNQDQTSSNYMKCVLPANCPDGYFADNVSIKCVPQCQGSFGDPITRTCVTSCPINGTNVYYSDPITRLCSLTCSNDGSIVLIKNLKNQTCIATCQPGFFMNPLPPFNGSCQRTCSGGYFADNSTHLCVSVCPISPYLFGQTGTYTCVEDCLASNHFKYIDARLCVTDCPSGTFRDNHTRVCETTCTGFTYADDRTKYCVTNCTPNYAYDPTNLCVSSCDSPYYRDPTTFKCVLLCPTYPVAYFRMVNETDRKCGLSCPSGQYRDFNTMSCVTKCPASPITFADDTSGNCLAVCSINFFGYTTQRTCLPQCPTGMFADNLTRMCVSKCDPKLGLFGDSDISLFTPSCVAVCSSSSYADPISQTCVYNCNNFPKMYKFDNGNLTKPIRACVYSCPYPYVADNATSSCKFQCTSPSFPYIDQSTQQCVAKCTTPVYQFAYMPVSSTVNGTCVKFCPNGTFALLTNKTCVTKCPDGLYGSPTNNTCMATCTLADNYYADPYNNLCVTECTHTSTYFSYADQFSRMCVQTCPQNKSTFGDRLNWKCMRRCSNITQFADPSNRTCVSQCPQYYFADIVSQTCVSNCSITTLRYGDTNSRVCVEKCLTTILYADDATRLCVTAANCTSGFFGLNTSKVCVAKCPTDPNLFGDPTTRTCVPTCPPTYYADYVSRTCMRVCPQVPALYGENGTRTCVSSCPPLNNTFTFADNYTRFCIATCSIIPFQTFADNTTSQCVRTCPFDADYYASNATWQCVRNCPSNPSMYADNSTRSCVYYCPRGIINTFADDSTRRCVDICPNTPNITYNENSTQKCVPLCLTGFADPKTKFCIAVCPRYTYGDNSTVSCVPECPIFNGQQTYAEDNNNLCMYTCLANFSTFRDISTKRCVRICPISQNFFADVVNRQCVSICPIYFGQPITYADPSTRFCVSTCPSVPALYAANVTINATLHRLCVAVCPAGTWSDNNTRSCLPLCITSPQTFGDNSTWACVLRCPTKPYTFANNHTRICVPVCPTYPDYYGDNITQRCVFNCPNDTFADPVSRRCVTTCPDGYYGQNSSRRCVQNCPWKQFADNLTRLCVAKCSVDPIFYGNPDNLLCIPQCPASNFSFGNPLTQQCVNYQLNGTSGCPITYFADNLTRLCVQVCPMSQDTYGDNSTWKCVSQCPIVNTSATSSHNTYADNSTMRCVNVCPSYPDYYGEPYSRRCAYFCLRPSANYSGSFSDNSTRTCVQQCPSNPDYYSDNSTGRCVYYCPRYPLTFADNTTRRCVDQCPIATPPMYGDLKSLRCVTRCPKEQQTFGDYTTRLCVLTCPSNPPLYADNFTQTCVPSINCSNRSFADNLTRRCVKTCPRHPETYGDNTTNSCVSVCPSIPSLFADPNTQQCIPRCPDGFFAQNNTRKCLQTCLYNITNYADNSTNRCVLRCPANLTYGDNETKRCVSQCPSQPMAYADNITQTCLPICMNVTDGGYADNVSRVCVVQCPSGSYGDITTRYCVRYCPNGWYAHSATNLCVSYCPSPFFADNSTWSCVSKCPVSQNLFGQKVNNTCVVVCPQGTYASQQNQQCVTRCPNSTQTRFGHNTWGYNDTNYCVNQCPIISNIDLYGYPVAQVCVNICPNPYYPNITDHLCYLCPFSCASCSYPQLCLTCNLGYFLYSGACVQSCPTFPVITFANPNRVCGTAFQCTQGFYALNLTKSCVQTCPAGTFVNVATQTCQNCMRGCISCQTADRCLLCNTNISIWSNNTCFMYCSARNRFYGTTGCVSQCPTGTFLSITTCRSCDATCRTCAVTSQNCLICANGLYQSNGICVSTCPSNTTPRLVNGSQSCVSCAITDCTVKPLTFSTTQFASNMQYTVQVQFNQAVNITDAINNVIKLQQRTSGRLLQSTTSALNYTIIDNGNGLYSFVFNNFKPGQNSQIQVQITNPSAIVGPGGQIPTNTRSSVNVDTTLIYSASDYHKGIDDSLFAIAIIGFLLLIFSFGMEHSIWMPFYDYLQLIMALLFINVNYPPDVLYSVFKLFASALTFLPNLVSRSFSKAPYNPELISNNIYATIQDSAFLRVMGHLYFVLICLVIVLAIIFILSKKNPNKEFKKWCKTFIRETFWRKHLHGLISLFFLPVFVIAIFNMPLYSYFTTQPIQGFSIFSSYLFMVSFMIPIIYSAYKLRKTIKAHPHVYLMLQKAYNFILMQETVLIENKNNHFTHQKNEVDLSDARQPKINQIHIFPYPIQTKVGPYEIIQPYIGYTHKLLTAIFLSMGFKNPVIQLIFLMLNNLGYMIYIILKRPFFKVKTRQYNNEIYIHNLLVVTLIEAVILIFVFMSNQLPTGSKVLLGIVICAMIIQGALVNLIYFFMRTYNYHHRNTWQPFVRSQMFRINYTAQYLEWTKEYDQKQKKLASQVRPRNEFLQAIQVKTGEALANMVKQMSISTSTKQKMKNLKLRPNRSQVISKQYGQIITNLANDKERSHKSVESSQRLSKMQRKKLRDIIFAEKMVKDKEDNDYVKLQIIDEKSEIRIEQDNPSEEDEDDRTQYEYEFIQEEYPEGTPMEVILKGCKKGDIALPI